MMTAAIIGEQNLIDDPRSYISDKKLPAIQKAALNACDALDGVKDGIINNPAQCRFDPAVLLCPTFTPPWFYSALDRTCQVVL
jgi:feruloyl esterase